MIAVNDKITEIKPSNFEKPYIIVNTGCARFVRKIITIMEERCQEIEILHLNKSKTLSSKTLLNVFSKTNNLYDIFSVDGSTYLTNKERIPDMKISELIEFIKENPSLLKYPILVDKNNVTSGYNQEIYEDCIKGGIANG